MFRQERVSSNQSSGKRTKPGFIGDNVARHEGNVAREAVGPFVNVQERAKSVSRAVLQITLDRRCGTRGHTYEIVETIFPQGTASENIQLQACGSFRIDGTIDGDLG